MLHGLNIKWVRVTKVWRILKLRVEETAPGMEDS